MCFKIDEVMFLFSSLYVNMFSCLRHLQSDCNVAEDGSRQRGKSNLIPQAEVLPWF